MARALAWRRRLFNAYSSGVFSATRPDGPLTHISQCFDAALNVGLLRSAQPGAVTDPEGRLEQLDEDRLVRLWDREYSPVL